jgi:hypothetical protein
MSSVFFRFRGGISGRSGGRFVDISYRSGLHHEDIQHFEHFIFVHVIDRVDVEFVLRVLDRVRHDLHDRFAGRQAGVRVHVLVRRHLRELLHAADDLDEVPGEVRHPRCGRTFQSLTHRLERGVGLLFRFSVLRHGEWFYGKDNAPGFPEASRSTDWPLCSSQCKWDYHTQARVILSVAEGRAELLDFFCALLQHEFEILDMVLNVV